MQGWLRPEGDHAPGVYWLRRLLLVGVFAVIGLATYAVLTKPAPAPNSPTPATSPAATPAPPTTVASSAPPSAPPPPKQCEPKSLKLALATPPEMKPSAEVPLTLSVSNTGPTACVLALNSKSIALVLSRDKEIVWSSTECERRLGTVPAAMTVDPGKGVEWTTKWPGKKAGAGCSLTDDVLASGTYQFAATVIDGPAAQQSVLLK